MATIDRTSPSMFQGLSWDEWADTVAHEGEKDATEDDEESQEVSGEEGRQRHNDNCQVMRLKREDSDLFGICPTQDEFYLVVCEQCGQVVKPQALERHIEQRHGRPPGNHRPTRANAALGTQIETDVEMHSEPLNSSSSQPSLQEEQELLNATESIKEEAQGPPEIEQAQVVIMRPESPLEEAQAPTLQNVQETEVQQSLLPQEEHDVPPTLQNELPMPHHNDERACNQLNVPSNHKMTTSGSKKQKKAPALACLKVKNGGKEETPKKKPAKKNLPSPRKIRTGDNIPCKDREFDANKHCGVWIEDIKRQCTRSLTCKTHALGLRRKVEGRRKPFDDLLKEHKAAKEILVAERKAMVAAQEAMKNAAKGITVTTGTTLTIPTTSLANIQPAKLNTVLVAPTLMNTHSLAPNEKSKGTQKNAPAMISTTKPLSINIVNSVLPIKRPPPPCTPPTPSLALAENHTSAPTTPITPKPMEGVAGQRLGGEGDKEPVDRGGGGTTAHVPTSHRLESCVQCHPRPAGMCTFGTRQVGKGVYVHNRRLDYLRSTVAALVERHLRPPPLKKMCFAADSRHHLMSSPTATTSTTTQYLICNLTLVQLRPSSPSPQRTPLHHGHVDRRRRSGHACGRLRSCIRQSNTGQSIRGKTSSSVVHNSVSKGQSTGNKKSSAKQAGANRTAKSSGNTTQPKTSKSRKKSGSGGGKGGAQNRTNVSSAAMMQGVLSVSSANPVVTISSAPMSNATYSFVTNSGLQAADLVGRGIVGIDASGNITDANLLKNLQFVVTSVEASVNGGTTGTIVTHPTSGTITVPILNTAMGTTPVLLSNLGPLALQHDGKMNIKSRPASAGAASKSKSRKHSGGNTSGALAHTVTVAPHPIMVDNFTQDNTSSSGGGNVGIASTGVILAQPAPSPVASSVASPMLRPSSSSPQLASPLHNGIIPSPTVAIKPFPSSTPTAVAVNHVQTAISPSRNSTPSPGGAGSAEASPCSGVVSHQTFIGVSQTGKGGTSRSGSHKRKQQMIAQQPVAPAPAPPQVHHLPFTTQQLLTNLVARDAQGKIVPILQNQIFNSIPVQQAPTGSAAAAAVMQGALTVTTATTEQGSKGTPPPPQTVLPQAIALTLQQQHHHQGQPIRLQTTQGLTEQSQVVLSSNDDTRRELQLQH
ncbi:LOW QUALITY PROTEIN: uncharacterized protein [Amphiura filiformis]|uniref:LOW QUALITY PROTEIN: uncharacterized protein n=1 Tax=Amphiura filiformis TaxID=82378 RepID=UPI003B222D57